MILCRSPNPRQSLVRRSGDARMGFVIDATQRFTERHARHYIHLYRTKSGPEAKKWALEVLAKEPRERMIVKVNDMLKNKKGSV